MCQQRTIWARTHCCMVRIKILWLQNPYSISLNPALCLRRFSIMSHRLWLLACHGVFFNLTIFDTLLGSMLEIDPEYYLYSCPGILTIVWHTPFVATLSVLLGEDNLGYDFK